MNITDMLLAMNSGPKASVWLMSFEYATNWSCHVSGIHDDVKYEIKVEGDSMADAVNIAYSKWNRVTNRLPEFLGALPPPLADDAQEGDHFVTPATITADDDIPF